MAFSTLGSLRSDDGGLNDELGLLNDTDNEVFGSTVQRNAFLIKAIRRLWPNVARLTREEITTATNQSDFILTTLYDVERIEITDTTGQVSDRVKSWQLYADETGDPPVLRLLLPRGIEGGRTVRLIGYLPYAAPTNADGSVLDIPPRLEHLVLAGGVMLAYKFAVGRFVRFERFQNENRSNAVSASDMVGLYTEARREFNSLMTQHARALTGSRRTQLSTLTTD